MTPLLSVIFFVPGRETECVYPCAAPGQHMTGYLPVGVCGLLVDSSGLETAHKNC